MRTFLRATLTRTPFRTHMLSFPHPHALSRTRTRTRSADPSIAPPDGQDQSKLWFDPSRKDFELVKRLFDAFPSMESVITADDGDNGTTAASDATGAASSDIQANKKKRTMGSYGVEDASGPNDPSLARGLLWCECTLTLISIWPRYSCVPAMHTARIHLRTQSRAHSRVQLRISSSCVETASSHGGVNCPGLGGPLLPRGGCSHRAALPSSRGGQLQHFDDPAR